MRVFFSVKQTGLSTWLRVGCACLLSRYQGSRSGLVTIVEPLAEVVRRSGEFPRGVYICKFSSCKGPLDREGICEEDHLKTFACGVLNNGRNLHAGLDFCTVVGGVLSSESVCSSGVLPRKRCITSAPTLVCRPLSQRDSRTSNVLPRGVAGR